jgi:EAL domain-containing protein (putative c-di-GMP-specific phosphodiesterase class I)
VGRNDRIVAEGVGTLEQLRFPRAEGCDLVQGFLMSPPVPARAFMALLRNARATPASSETGAESQSVLARLSASR